MGATDAERQRRYRAHKAGDHSLCDPARRCDETSRVTGVTRPVAEPKFAAGGRRLWADLDGGAATGARRALVIEACRIVDRLDKLDRMLTGDAEDWVRLVEQRGHEDIIEIVIDKPLSEARQQATALKQIAAELRQSSAKSDTSGKEGGLLDELAARRARRLANAAG